MRIETNRISRTVQLQGGRMPQPSWVMRGTMLGWNQPLGSAVACMSRLAEKRVTLSR